MEIKRRLRALCKATSRALEYIIEQCQHLFLITFANGSLFPPHRCRQISFPLRRLQIELYRLSETKIGNGLFLTFPTVW